MFNWDALDINQVNINCAICIIIAYIMDHHVEYVAVSLNVLLYL